MPDMKVELGNGWTLCAQIGQRTDAQGVGVNRRPRTVAALQFVLLEDGRQPVLIDAAEAQLLLNMRGQER